MPPQRPPHRREALVDVVRWTGPARKPIDRCPSSTRWSTARRSPTSLEKPTSGLPSGVTERAARRPPPPPRSGRAGGRPRAMGAVAQTAGGEQDRVDLHRPQLAHVVQLLVRIAIGVADERHVAVGVRLVLDAPRDLAEVLVHHIVDHHGDGLRTAARQTAGEHVGLEVERSRRLEDQRCAWVRRPGATNRSARATPSPSRPSRGRRRLRATACQPPRCTICRRRGRARSAPVR